MKNFIVVEGRLTRDPDIKVSTGGKTFFLFSIAISRDYFKDGSWVKKDPIFIDCVLWEPDSVEELAKKLYKGTPVSCTGKIDMNSWEKDGIKHSKIQIILDKDPFVIKQAKTQDQQTQPSNTSQPAPTEKPFEDDIPF